MLWNINGVCTLYISECVCTWRRNVCVIFFFRIFILYILKIGIFTPTHTHRYIYIPAGICHCQKIMLFAQSFKHVKWVPEDSNLLQGMCHRRTTKIVDLFGIFFNLWKFNWLIIKIYSSALFYTPIPPRL